MPAPVGRSGDRQPAARRVAAGVGRPDGAGPCVGELRAPALRARRPPGRGGVLPGGVEPVPADRVGERRGGLFELARPPRPRRRPVRVGAVAATAKRTESSRRITGRQIWRSCATNWRSRRCTSAAGSDAKRYAELATDVPGTDLDPALALSVALGHLGDQAGAERERRGFIERQDEQTVLEEEAALP